jgi:hypothetical protein
VPGEVGVPPLELLLPEELDELEELELDELELDELLELDDELELLELDDELELLELDDELELLELDEDISRTKIPLKVPLSIVVVTSIVRLRSFTVVLILGVV